MPASPTTEIIETNPTRRRMRTMDELRADLSDAMDQLNAGQTTPAIANAKVNVAAAVIRTYKVQMDYAKQTGQTPNIPDLLGPSSTTADGESVTA